MYTHIFYVFARMEVTVCVPLKAAATIRKLFLEYLGAATIQEWLQLSAAFKGARTVDQHVS